MRAMLKLATRSQPSIRPLAIAGAERRMFARKDSSAHVEGQRLDHSLTARQNPQLTLSLRDISLGGLSAITELPLGKGERLAITFPPHAFNGGWARRGRVIRCEPGAVGYRVAVEFELDFDPMPMAA